MHVEEKEFTFRLELRASFPEEYDGDADGYAWTEDIRPMTAEMMRALVQVVQRHAGWTVRPSNRGRSTEDEVTLIVERTFARAPG